MGDGYRPHRGCLDEAIDYWRMGPGPTLSRQEGKMLEPPTVEVVGTHIGTYYAVVHIVQLVGGGTLGINLGPCLTRTSAQRQGQRYVRDMNPIFWNRFTGESRSCD